MRPESTRALVPWARPHGSGARRALPHPILPTGHRCSPADPRGNGCRAIVLACGASTLTCCVVYAGLPLTYTFAVAAVLLVLVHLGWCPCPIGIHPVVRGHRRRRTASACGGAEVLDRGPALVPGRHKLPWQPPWRGLQ